ncbi:MAG TPA: Holliday junction branch migration protein RuvA [Candidatus Saccharimonadales bacterium]|nr:Holliday junction branch migration protein RuvA [Candidatus Saccharimonadales bacterium]
MIATLSGTVSEKLADIVVLDVNGVGYGILTTIEDYAQLVAGEKTKLYVHEHIREDAHDLYGFTSLDTQKLFEQLLSVKNVGPKVALAVLGIGNSTEVRSAIASGDVKRLQTAKGVGKRAAEQMVVELRDKVGLAATDDAEGIVSRGAVNTSDEAIQALVSLGYTDTDAQLALKGIDSALPTEERIKQALKAKV